LNPILGLVWSLKGHQPEVPTRSERQRVHLTGFVDPKTGDYLFYRSEKGNTKSFLNQIRSLDQMKLHYLKEEKVTIYVDNARWHHAKAIRDWEIKNILSKSITFHLIYQS